MLMRQLFLSFLTASSLLMLFPSDAKAQVIPDDEGVIVIDITTNTTETGPKRSPAIIPINANYYVLSSCLEVRFLHDMGDVTVSVVNITTGDHYSTITESYCGTAIFHLLLSSGLWTITFSTDDGNSYIGFFNIY